MSRTSEALRDLTAAVADLVRTNARLASVLSDIAREQRTTNLIVLAQSSADPGDRAGLLLRARTRITAERRKDRRVRTEGGD